MGECLDVGDANPDIAGIGVVFAFVIQAAIAILVSLISSLLKLSIVANGETGSARIRKIIGILNDTLIAGNDSQVITGTALLLSAIVQLKTLPFYHLHIIYDTVSFVAISICAATTSSFGSNLKGRHLRYIYIFIWSILYLTYTILFGIHLRSWNYDSPGLCYDTSKLTLPNASHPEVDHIYISITFFYVFTFLIVAACTPIIQEAMHGQARYIQSIAAEYTSLHEPDDLIIDKSYLILVEGGVLGGAAFQFPLHLYSLFTLRASNEHLLHSGNTEQQWGFGQIVAMLILVQNLTVLLNGIGEYRDWSFQRDNPGKQRRSNVEAIFAFLYI